MGVTDKLTKRVGPLPVWGYGAAAIGGYLGYKLLTGGGKNSAGPQYVATPTGAPQFDPGYPSSGAFEALRQRLEEVAGRDTSPPATPAPASAGEVVRNTYQNILRRSAEAGGIEFWQPVVERWLNEGMTPIEAQERLEEEFRLSPEYLSKSPQYQHNATIGFVQPLPTGAIGNPASGQNTIPTDPNAASIKRRTGGQIRESYRPGRIAEPMRAGSAISSPAPPASVTPTRLPTPPISIPFLAPTTRPRAMPVSAGPNTPTISVGERAHLFKGRFQNPFRRG